MLILDIGGYSFIVNEFKKAKIKMIYRMQTLFFNLLFVCKTDKSGI